MQFYSVVTKKKVEIPNNQIGYKTVKGHKFAVGKYKANGKSYTAWKAVPKK